MRVAQRIHTGILVNERRLKLSAAGQQGYELLTCMAGHTPTERAAGSRATSFRRERPATKYMYDYAVVEAHVPGLKVPRFFLFKINLLDSLHFTHFNLVRTLPCASRAALRQRGRGPRVA